MLIITDRKVCMHARSYAYTGAGTYIVILSKCLQEIMKLNKKINNTVCLENSSSCFIPLNWISVLVFDLSKMERFPDVYFTNAMPWQHVMML